MSWLGMSSAHSTRPTSAVLIFLNSFALSPVPELSFLPAPHRGEPRGLNPGGRKEESRITCMRMLGTNQSKITRLLSIRARTCSRERVAQYLFQLALWKKNFLWWCWYCGKKQIDRCFIVVCTLIDNDYALLLFSQTFFRIVSAFWASLQKVLKGKSDAFK